MLVITAQKARRRAGLAYSKMTLMMFSLPSQRSSASKASPFTVSQEVLTSRQVLFTAVGVNECTQ